MIDDSFEFVFSVPSVIRDAESNSPGRNDLRGLAVFPMISFLFSFLFVTCVFVFCVVAVSAPVASIGAMTGVMPPKLLNIF